MLSARMLERAVWIFLGLSGFFVVLGSVVPFGPTYAVRFGDVGRDTSVSFPGFFAGVCLVVGLVALLGSFFATRSTGKG